jgi:hypothetical protein
MPAELMRPTVDELDRMHDLYRQGGQERQMAPHIVYSEAACPHTGCGHRMQAIRWDGFEIRPTTDFRLEAHGRSIYDLLVRAWWDDTGFAGRCPGCNNWVHFTIRAKHAIPAEEAARLPRLPDDWHSVAIIL